MIVEPYELPPAVSEKCLELMRRLGIIFGCFDFIVTPDGRHVFLEVNPMGQWLWVEQMCGMPLLEAFCEFLGAEGVPEIEVRDEALALVGPRREVPEPENV
jgi:glutathione synthase/RimK-type ligase-like ATP-grasp enzyme